MGSQGWGGSMQRDLSVSDPFAARHIGPSSDDQRAMLATLGYETLDDLIKAALPAEIPDASQAAPSLAKLPAARTETQVLADLRRLASRNPGRRGLPPEAPRRAAPPGRAARHRAAGSPGHGIDRLRRRLRRPAAVPGRV